MAMCLKANSYLLRKTFSNRGYDQKFLDSLNDIPQTPLSHLDEMCENLKMLHDTGEVITLMTDFDFDGINCAVIGFAGLKELGFEVRLHQCTPSRGYGLTEKDLSEALGRFPDTVAILTADVGIACYGLVRMAKDAGLMVFITDHHEPGTDGKGKEKLPEADVIVDPMREDNHSENKQICGAYVLWQVLERYAELYDTSYGYEQIRRLRVFAGFGTVSDTMPMLHDNRLLVRDAISICRMLYSEGNDFVVDNISGCPAYRGVFYGLYDVLCCLRDHEKLKSASDINEDFFGYYLAPMFNSVKRMQKPIDMAFSIFFDPAGSKAHAEDLYQLNEARKEAVADGMEKLPQRPQAFAPYIWLSDCSAGLLGLLAQKLRDAYGLPVLVVNPANNYSGSGRAPGWYPKMMHKLRSLKGISAGGHASAFGISLGDEDTAAKTREYIGRDVMGVIAEIREKSGDESFVGEETAYDFVIAPDGSGDIGIDIISFMDYIYELRNYAPFGPGFESPRVGLKFMADDVVSRRMGDAKQHIKLSFGHGFEAVLFNQGQAVEDALAHSRKSGEELFLTGYLSLNVFMDRYSISFYGNLKQKRQVVAI